MQQSIQVGQIVADVVRMSDGLKVRSQQLALTVPEQVTKRSIHAQPRSLRRHKRHPNRGVIKRVTKVLFRFAQSLTDARLLGDVAIQFLNVTARLLGLRGRALDVLHIGPICEINDRDDRNGRAESKEADVADEARDETCRRSSGEVCNRRPQKILAPGSPDRLISFQCRVRCYQ